MKTSDQIHELADALAKAQGQMEGAAKDATNPHFKSKYADLASVWEACRAPLSTNGLSVVQAPRNEDDGSVTVTTRLMHISGQWIEADLNLPVAKKDAHSYGSAITYGRRYLLAAMVGVYQEDDDGNGGCGKGDQSEEQKKPSSQSEDKKPQQEAPQKSPIAIIMELKDQLCMTNDDLSYSVKEVLGVEKLQGQSTEMARKLIIFLNGLIEEKIPFAKWKADRLAEDKKLRDSIGEIPEFPV